MPNNDWTKRCAQLSMEAHDLRLQALDVGDAHRDDNLLKAARQLTVALSALAMARTYFAKVNL